MQNKSLPRSLKITDALKTTETRQITGKAANSIRLPHADARIDHLIARYAESYNLPQQFVRRFVARESGGNPAARNGQYCFGLLQISHPPARNIGYRGLAEGLLNAETNLRYAVKYLAGAYNGCGKKRGAGDPFLYPRLLLWCKTKGPA